MTWTYRKKGEGVWEVVVELAPVDQQPVGIPYATVLTEKDAAYLARILNERDGLREHAGMLVDHLRYGFREDGNRNWDRIDKEACRITDILEGRAW